MSGAEVKVTGVVEQEISTRATVAPRPKPAATARYRPGLFFAGWPVTNDVSDKSAVRFQAIGINRVFIGDHHRLHSQATDVLSVAVLLLNTFHQLITSALTQNERIGRYKQEASLRAAVSV